MWADFLGKGWKFPIEQGAGAAVAMSAAEQSVAEAVWIILATAPGERVRRPDFGCGIHQLVFEVNNAATLGQVRDRVHSALVKWEPRIQVEKVNVEARGGGEELLINVHYRVRDTNNYFNLVFPFYLMRGAVQ
jgi:uncharacterized protein